MTSRRFAIPGLFLLALAIGLLLAASLAIRTVQAGGEAPVPGIAAWTQAGPDGELSFRLIQDPGSCPSLRVDGVTRAMRQRVGPTADFPNQVCELTVPRGARNVLLGEFRFPVWNGAMDRVVVVGDTGCRIKGDFIQACNDPKAWPYAEVSDSMARERADVIIHVGDYYYRETACPAGNAGCAGSPWGDNWASWNAEVFTPMAGVLPTVPFLWIRGDHETCERGGKGWFRYLEASAQTECVRITDPWTIPTARETLLVLDLSYPSDTHPSQDDIRSIRGQLQTLAAQAGPRAWMVTHKPLWSIGITQQPGGTYFFGNGDFVSAIEPLLPYPAQLFLAGHQHLFAAIGLQGQAPQFVVGQGGTLLDDDPAPLPPTMTVGGAAIEHASFITRFGYIVLTPAGDGWSGLVRDEAGRTIARCQVPRGAISCGG